MAHAVEQPGNGRTFAINLNSAINVGVVIAIIGATWTLATRLATIETHQAIVTARVSDLNRAVERVVESNIQLTTAMTRLQAVSDDRREHDRPQRAAQPRKEPKP